MLPQSVFICPGKTGYGHDAPQATVIGDRARLPLDEKTVMGPLANQVQLEKVLRLIQRAREEGDTIVYGGETLPGEGYFYSRRR